MCNQAVSLAAAEIERAGIPTVTLALLRMVVERVRPPRALWVPYSHGFALGRANDPVLQNRVLDAAFALFETPGPAPVLRDFPG
jgi:hypothetical protein